LLLTRQRRIKLPGKVRTVRNESGKLSFDHVRIAGAGHQTVERAFQS
jgi:hypothetical protein